MTKNNKGINKKQRLYAIIAVVAAIIAIVVMIILFISTGTKKDGDDEIQIAENFEFLVEHESTMLKNYSDIKDQNDLAKKYMDEYNKGNYTIDNPYIIVDPFENAPQTALVMFKTSKKESVTMVLKGKHNDDWTKKFEASTDHYIPIFGLYGDYTNEVIITTESGKKASIQIKIEGTIQPNVDVDVMQNDLGNQNGQVYFSTSTFGAGNVAYDNYGEVRWYTSVPYNIGMTLLQNGNLLLSAANRGPDIMSSSGVIEIDMFGRTVREYEIVGGYHHDAYELENGNLIVLSTDVEGVSLSDYIVEINRNTGKTVKDWKLRDIVTAIDDKLLTENDVVWAFINSVTYDKEHDALVLSLRNANSVVSIDYKTGNINWILGKKDYWSNKFDKYLIKGVGSNFVYPAGQHSVNITKDGKLSIFNNNYNAHNAVDMPCSKIKNSESYAMVYGLDLNNMTATLDYSYGGNEYYSFAASSYTYTSDNHKIFGPAWHFTSSVDFDSPSCTIFTNDRYETFIVEFDENDKMLLKMRVAESKFETLKSDIYNLKENSISPKKVTTYGNYKFIDGQYLSAFEPDVPEELTKDEALEFEQNEPLFISFALHDNRFTLNGAVPNDMDMKIIFISPSGKAYRYTLKEKNKEIKLFVDISKMPKGRYYIYVSMDEFVYNTTQHIEL